MINVGSNILFIVDNDQINPLSMTQTMSKKKSILRKDSFLGGSCLGATWKSEKKKSVLFKTS